ncbi:hypothetical protein [uncultured Phascolarctobacterium sp.]|mgnify:FL=1|uniref:hypothetical protein n=1 Tax=uncultured Phascolarctobacterium sp. TaxID=512296 RepID=UPI0025FD3A78|nr:hypothetical protein [uncultured Phascolarctobacterium sp.]
MKIDFEEYQDIQIKAKKFYEINLKNVAFEHGDIVRDAIQWFIGHDYQKLKAIANKNEAFENSLNVFVYSLKDMINAGYGFLADKDRIMETVLSFNVLKISYEERLKIYSTDEEDFVKYKKRITTLENKINELNNKIERLIKNNQYLQENVELKISDTNKMYDELTAEVMKSSTEAKVNIDNLLKEYSEHVQVIKSELNSKNEKAQSEVIDIVESIEDIKNDVHRNKLSRYFSNEHIKLKRPFKENQFNSQYWGWLGATFLGMISILLFAVYIINSFDSKSGTNITQVMVKLPFMMTLVWFTWFCSKQFSYVKQICDEYEYKYVLSESYIAYRDEARAIAKNINDEHILAVLLDSVIKNIATSPVQTVKFDSHIPFSELIGAIKSNVKNKDK